jgi:hypothetical protein
MSKTKCISKNTKKYKTRSSPAYPANDCKKMKKMGNDGTYYNSVKDINGVYKWKSVKSKTQKRK